MNISQIYINLPVADIEVSRKFYEGLGASINPQFTDDESAQVVLSDTIYLQLMTHDRFRSFSDAPVPDGGVPAMYALSAGSREEVDVIADAALGAGGGEPRAAQDMGWMYNRAFTDPDGHYWEVASLDEAAMAEAFADES